MKQLIFALVISIGGLAIVAGGTAGLIANTGATAQQVSTVSMWTFGVCFLLFIGLLIGSDGDL